MSFLSWLKRGPGLRQGRKSTFFGRSWRTGLAAIPLRARMELRPAPSKDRTSRTRPAPTVRARCSVTAQLCLYIGTHWCICTPSCAFSPSPDVVSVCFCFSTLVSSHLLCTAAVPSFPLRINDLKTILLWTRRRRSRVLDVTYKSLLKTRKGGTNEILVHFIIL